MISALFNHFQKNHFPSCLHNGKHNFLVQSLNWFQLYSIIIQSFYSHKFKQEIHCKYLFGSICALLKSIALHFHKNEFKKTIFLPACTMENTIFWSKAKVISALFNHIIARNLSKKYTANIFWLNLFPAKVNCIALSQKRVQKDHFPSCLHNGKLFWSKA